jgi:hypothetical protein
MEPYLVSVLLLDMTGYRFIYTLHKMVASKIQMDIQNDERMLCQGSTS